MKRNRSIIWMVVFLIYVMMINVYGQYSSRLFKYDDYADKNRSTSDPHVNRELFYSIADIEWASIEYDGQFYDLQLAIDPVWNRLMYSHLGENPLVDSYIRFYDPTGIYSLSSPRAVCVSKFGEIYIADYENSKIVQLDFNKSTGEASFESNILVGLNKPIDISITDPGTPTFPIDDYLIITDNEDNSIIFATTQGNIVAEINEFYIFNSPNEHLNSPTSAIAVYYPEGSVRWQLWVADNGNERVVCINLDQNLSQISNAGIISGPTYFSSDIDLREISHGFDNAIFVVERNYHRIHKFDNYLSQLAYFGGYGQEQNKLIEPNSIAFADGYAAIGVSEKWWNDSGLKLYYPGAELLDFWVEHRWTSQAELWINMLLPNSCFIDITISKKVGSVYTAVRNMNDLYFECSPMAGVQGWDFKDNSGQIVQEGNYKIDLIIESPYVDNNNNPLDILNFENLIVLEKANKPTNLTLTPYPEYPCIEISWDPVDNIHQGYILEKSTNGSDYVEIDRGSEKRYPFYWDYDYSQSNNYSYRVRSENIFGLSDWVYINTFSGGSITSDLTLVGEVEIIEDINVNSEVTLTINPGTIIKLMEDCKIEVYGTLTVSGTQSSPILFTSINSNPSISDWYGIIVRGTANINQATIEYSNMGIYFSSGGSGTVENCTISNNRYGIRINRSHPYVANCSIHNNYYPIHLYMTNYVPEQPQILNNSVYDNSSLGIYLHQSSPDIRGNVIYNHGKGLYCRFSSSPYLGESGYHGENLIYNNDYAVYAFQSSNPFLGQDGGGINGGNNNVIGTDYHVYARYSCNIMAENNYWGSNPPVANKFYTANNSSIDYTPWLPYGPIYSRENFLTDQTNSANPGDEFNPDWPLRKQLLFARDMIDISELDIAQEICKSVIKDSPDSSLAFFALDILWQAARKGVRLQKMELEQFTNYLDSLANKKDKRDLYAYANLILFGYDAYNSLNRLDFVINEYKNTRMEELALFTKFMYFLFDKEDLPSAKKVLSELEKRFPQSESTQEGFRLLSDLDDSNAENFFNKPIADQSSLPQKYELLGNFPNPFNPETKIRFNLPEDSQVKLEIYNIQGQRVITLVDKMLPAGIHTATFIGSNYSSGIYFYKIVVGEYSEVKRMLLIK